LFMLLLSKVKSVSSIPKRFLKVIAVRWGIGQSKARDIVDKQHGEV